jgi:hypothetical protein
MDSLESISMITRPVRPKAVVWYRCGSEVTHHLRTSARGVRRRLSRADNVEELTLGFKELKLSIEELKMRFGEDNLW